MASSRSEISERVQLPRASFIADTAAVPLGITSRSAAASVRGGKAVSPDASARETGSLASRAVPNDVRASVSEATVSTTLASDGWSSADGIVAFF